MGAQGTVGGAGVGWVVNLPQGQRRREDPMTDPARWDVATLTAAFRAHTLSPVEALAAVRARIDRWEPVNC